MTDRLLSALVLLVAVSLIPRAVRAQQEVRVDRGELEQEVAEILQGSCARTGCHAGANAQMGLSLQEADFVAQTVDVSSRERPGTELVEPGAPDSSYLVQKIRGDAGITGARMPMTGSPLTDSQIATIEQWVRDLEGREVEGGPGPRYAFPFDGWKVLNQPTSRMVNRGQWLFTIGHRFVPRISSGYGTLFGLDGSGSIMLTLGYAPTNDLLVSLGRANAGDHVELDLKYRPIRQQLDAGSPLGVALQSSVEWKTEAPGDESIYAGGMFGWTGQIILTRQLSNALGVTAVPGLTLNSAHDQVSGEPALWTLGLGGRWKFYRNFSLLAEWTPVLGGFTRTRTLGEVNRFDSFGTGLEITTGGHVFQVFLTNSVGLATSQYLRGGGLDVPEEGHVRLGFNIYRVLDL